MRSRDFKLNVYRFFIFGLVIVFFVCRIDAQGINNSNRLVGSYQLDSSRSESINSIIENTSRTNRLTSADRIDLENKLNPPAAIAIQINGKQVVLTSSTSDPVTLTADGSLATAYSTSGIQVSIRSSLIKDTLKVSSLYDGTDYSITFKSINNGNGLQVTRTVKTRYLQQTVTGQSFYNRTDSPSSFVGGNNSDSRLSNGDFIVPNGTVLTVILENNISTKNSQNSDMFRLTVQTPGEFQGAMIEGYLSEIERANGISGRAKMTLNFQRILLTNGQSYDFTGIIQSISDIKDTAINSNDESQVKGKSKTNETIKRGVLGAGVGAVIGAAINGKSGAVIGAAIGGGAGTGTVLLESKDLEIQRGSQINIQSTSLN